MEENRSSRGRVAVMMEEQLQGQTISLKITKSSPSTTCPPTTPTPSDAHPHSLQADN